MARVVFTPSVFVTLTDRGRLTVNGFAAEGLGLHKVGRRDWAITHIGSGRWMLKLNCRKDTVEQCAREIIKHARLIGCDLTVKQLQENHLAVLGPACKGLAEHVNTRNRLSPGSA